VTSEVDEDWYLLPHPGVASAIDAELSTSAIEHLHVSACEKVGCLENSKRSNYPRAVSIVRKRWQIS
jgi:hypothetical protein